MPLDKNILKKKVAGIPVPILAVGGITMIRTRGETACAVLALVLVLAMTTFSSPLLFYGTFGE